MPNRVSGSMAALRRLLLQCPKVMAFLGADADKRIYDHEAPKIEATEPPIAPRPCCVIIDQDSGAWNRELGGFTPARLVLTIERDQVHDACSDDFQTFCDQVDEIITELGDKSMTWDDPEGCLLIRQIRRDEVYLDDLDEVPFVFAAIEIDIGLNRGQ